MEIEDDSECQSSGVGVLDGLLYAVGGHDGPLVRKSVEVYNPDTNCWTPVADMNLCRRNAGWNHIVVIAVLDSVPSLVCR